MSLFLAIIKLSLKNLWANKLRSFLTVLGIMIGVSSVIAMMALGTGAKEAMTAQIRSFGTNTLSLYPENRREGGAASANIQKLTVEDCKAILEEVGEIQSVSPEVDKNVQVKHGNKNVRTNVHGVTAAYLPMRNYQIEEGRAFNVAEEQGQRKVVLLGSKVIDQLFGPGATGLVGEEVKIDGTSYTVIGALKAKGDQGFVNPDDVVLIPYTTVMRRMLGSDNVHVVNIKIFQEDMLEEAIRHITRIMRKRHRLTPSKEDDFGVFSSKDAIRTFEALGAIFTLLLSGIASVSLLVGGIGIMNIMLVTVTERTREIGIRKALGAKRRDILRQFLIESVVISFMGGAIGVAIGIGMSAAASSFGVLTAKVSLGAVGLSLGVCVFIGTFFGIYPASKAARLDPIEALRYE